MKRFVVGACILFVLASMASAVNGQPVSAFRPNPVMVAASNCPAAIKAQAKYKCDGTNDEVQIQAAINSFVAYSTAGGGGKVVLSPGVFNIGATINVRGAITIEGQGVYATELKLANGANCDVFTGAPGVDQGFCRITALAIDGNKDQNTAGSGINFSANMWDSYLDHIFVKNCAGNGVIIGQGWGTIITDSVIEWCLEHELKITSGNHFKIANCKIIQSGKQTAPANWVTSTAYTVGQKVVASDTFWYKCAEAHTSGTWATDLAANKWTKYTADCLNLTAANGMIVNCELSPDVTGPPDSKAVNLTGPAASDINITNCQFTLNPGMFGIYAIGADRVGVTGNRFTGGKTQIWIDYNATNWLIASNRFSGATYKAVDDYDGKHRVGTNFGWDTRKTSQITITGDGSTTAFTVAHGMSRYTLTSPVYWAQITPTNAAAAAAGGYVSACDHTNVTITFPSAPGNGASLTFNLVAEVQPSA